MSENLAKKRPDDCCNETLTLLPPVTFLWLTANVSALYIHTRFAAQQQTFHAPCFVSFRISSLLRSRKKLWPFCGPINSITRVPLQRQLHVTTSLAPLAPQRRSFRTLQSRNWVPSAGRLQLKCDGTRWRTEGEAKGKLANGVGSQYPSHYLGTWCIEHYYRRCAHLGCQ